MAVHGQALRLDGLLSRAADVDPERTAVICGDLSLSYAQVDERARRLGGMLAGIGVEHGARVALWMANRAEFVEVLFGIPLLGAIAVPLDHWAKTDDIIKALWQVRPKALVVGGAQAAQLVGCAAELKALGIERVYSLDSPPDETFSPYAENLAASKPLDSPVPVSDDDPALILFTSGSTGRPKGAVHSHRDLCATAQIASLELGLRPHECTLHYLPLYSSCLEHLIPLTLMRATHVIMPSFDAAGAWEVIAALNVTHIDAVPTTLRRMLEHAPANIPEQLRLITFASEPMPMPLISSLMEAMPGVAFAQFYGMIEQLCLTVQGPMEQLDNPGTVGRPMMGAEIIILGADGKPSDGSTPGEIIARSPTMFSGYWGAPDATGLVIQDGWMRTGDIGHFDANGFLVLSGRLKQVIKSGGVSVIPKDVEEALLGHKRVQEAVVVGIPDATWGEAVHAFVVLKQGYELLQEDLIAYCRGKLPGYKTPKVIHFVGDLPRTGIGKVSRAEVRERYLRSREAGVVA